MNILEISSKKMIYFKCKKLKMVKNVIKKLLQIF